MPPDFQFEVSERLLTVTVTGVLLAEDVIRVVNAHYPQFRGPRILWNFTGADVSRLAPDKFADMAIAVRANTPPGVERKTAYVVANYAAQLSMWKYLSEVVRLHVPVEYKAFISLEAARQWLDER